MKFKRSIKQKIITKCSKCGYRASNNRAGTLASWFFHEQLCNCDKDLSPPKLIADQLNSSLPSSVRVDHIDKMDFGPQYEALEIIGRGGMGTVYKAIDKSTRQMVSIKVLHDSLAADQNILKRFEQEALSVQKLSHPNIVSVKEFGHTANGAPYIVMDYIEGDNLAKLIKKCGYLSVLDLLSILFQISEAIDHAHKQGIIHRDLKPSNIIVCAKESGFAVKVVDFGIAKAMSNPTIDEAHLTQTGDIVGSPAYMSPEQCLGEPVDERSDIYSLGCIMYEVLTGRNPFLSKNPVQAIVKQIEADAEPFEIEFSHLHIPKAMEKIKLHATRLKISKIHRFYGNYFNSLLMWRNLPLASTPAAVLLYDNVGPALTPADAALIANLKDIADEYNVYPTDPDFVNESLNNYFDRLMVAEAKKTYIMEHSEKKHRKER